MRAVLGIDAAWTATEPSGIALALEGESGWRLAAVESSYDRFIAHARGSGLGAGRPVGSKPEAAAILGAARALADASVECVAVDMPLSRAPIVGRRGCDNLISSRYGARGAAVHSPSAARPGKISDDFREGFEAQGYAVGIASPLRAIIEVYPHAALIEFMSAPRRLEYKVARIGRYWRDLGSADRHLKLRAVWSLIVEELERHLAGVAAALPPPPANVVGWRLKAYEDKLDAVVCAAVAIACLDGRATAYGDEEGAIWVPRP